MEKQIVNVKKLHEEAIVPTYGSDEVDLLQRKDWHLPTR